MNQLETPITSTKLSTKSQLKKRNWRQHFWGYVFLIPAIVIFILFLWMPIIKGMVFSFYQVDFVKGNTFIGLENYRTVFNDPTVWIATKNTLYYIFLCIVMGFWVPIFFAVAISELRRFRGFVRVAAYLPHVVPFVVLYGLWRWLYDPIGPINAFMGMFGIESIAFLTDPTWSMISLVFMETWQQFGAALLIYLAAILSIPREWYEAAEIDGAGVWQRFRFITLPSMKKLILLLFILQLIATSQAYQSQLAMLDGGPNNATLTYALLIVKYAFNRMDYGAASALGVLMFIVLVGLAILHFIITRKEDK